MQQSHKKDRFRLSFIVNTAVIILVVAWFLPTFGLLVTSFRDPDAIIKTGWWNALQSAEDVKVVKLPQPEKETQLDGHYIVEGQVSEMKRGNVLMSFGLKQNAIDSFTPGQVAPLSDGSTISFFEDGRYRWESAQSLIGVKPPRFYHRYVTPPEFSGENYRGVLYEKDLITNKYKLDENGNFQWSRSIARAFVNSLTVAIPSTIIPILFAAFCAYALAWMRFPGRAILIATIVGLLVVPLQLTLIPVLKTHVWFFGEVLNVDPKGYIQVWLAHTGFGLPLAIYLLRNYIAGLPRDIIESARIDGANDFNIFIRIILPLSVPALASFSIFQFLWTWNDFLVASIFLGKGEQTSVLTMALKDLLGTYGGNWEILSASAFISMIIPLVIFFSMQRFLVRGLLAGSVK